MKKNLRQLIPFFSFILTFGFSITQAQVDVTFTAVDESDTITLIYITGDMNTWAKDTMYDDGTHGDLVTGDHIWSRTITGINPGTYKWGLAADFSNWLISGVAPVLVIGDDNSVSGDTSYTLSFSNLIVDVTVSFVDISEGLTDVQFTGWSNGWSYEPMYDDGTNGDQTAGDHTWTRVISLRADRDYEWGAAEGGTQWLIKGSNPVIIIDSLGNVTGDTIYTYGGADITFTAIDESDTIPVLYLTGAMNAWAWDEMYDDGTHGDAVAGDHIWSLTIRNIPAGDYTWGLASDFSDWLISGYPVAFSVDQSFTVTGQTSYTLSYSEIMIDVTFTFIDNTEDLADVQFTGWMNGWTYDLMYDDGTNGDETAGDHTWSLIVSLRADRDYEWGAAEGGTQWLIQGTNPLIVVDSLGNVSGDSIYVYGATRTLNINENEISVYPNPASSYILIESTKEIERIAISNIIGQEIKQYNPDRIRNINLNVADLHKGIYLISLYNESGRFATMKFVKR